MAGRDDFTPLLEAFADAVGALDRETFMELLHPDTSFVTIPDWPDGGEFHGREEVWRFMSGFMAAFPVGERFELRDVVQRDDKAIMTLHRASRGASSGVEVEFVLELVVTVRDGLIFRQEYFLTREEALVAMRPAEKSDPPHTQAR